MSGPKRIVVADDDPDIRRLVVLKLTSAGHEVTAVGDGAAALEAIRRDPPDLAVLDVMMPGMTGVEVCVALRGERRTAGVPVILLTARVQESDVQTGFSSGADDYIAKPFSPRELVDRIRALLAEVPA